MSFWTGFAGGIQAGSSARDRWDERGGLSGLFGNGETTQAADKPMSDVSAAATTPATGDGAAAAPQASGAGSNATNASASVGEPLDLTQYMQRTRAVESAGDDNARARTSSASGRYQFIDSTWRQMMQNHPELNLTPAGRFDPAQQERAMRQFTMTNASILQRQGLPVTNANLYAMHFFGAGDGPKVLRADPNTPLSQVVSGASISANRFLAGQTAGWARNWTTRKVGDAPVRVSAGNRNVTSTTSGDAGEIEPIRVQPGEVEIPALFDNQVPANAGQQIRASSEVDGLVSSARRGAPGLAVTQPAARPLGPGEVDSATDPQLEEDAPPPAPIRRENADIAASGAARGGVARGASAAGAGQSPTAAPLRAGEVASSSGERLVAEGEPPAPIRGETAALEARAYARGGVGDGAGGRGAVSAVRPAPGLGVQARAVAPRALGPGEVDSATDPQMAASPEGSGTAAGYAGGAAGGRASASATVPGSTPQETPAPAARPAPRREAAPREEAPAAAPAPQARAQPAAERPANNPSERERLMLLRDPESLAPGEEERLRAGLPQNTLGMPDLMSLFRGRQAAAQTREKAAERTQPAARPAPSAGDPVTTGSVPAAPVRDEPSRAPVGPSGNVQEGDQPAAAPSAPAERAPDPVPYPEPRNDQERFANGRAAAQAALDRGEPPQRIAEGLTAAGVPVEEWPPALRQVRPAPRRGPVYDAQGQLMPEHGGLTGAAREQAMRTGRAPGIVMVHPR